MVTYAWLLWVSNAFFMLIILLNFLIAIISQSYDSVMTRQEQIVYHARCEFNVECTLISEFISSFTEEEGSGKASILTLSATIETNTGADMMGLVGPIKAFIKRELGSYRDKMTESGNKLKKEVATINDEVAALKKQINEDHKKIIDGLNAAL